jgi:hypothetical protein
MITARLLFLILAAQGPGEGAPRPGVTREAQGAGAKAGESDEPRGAREGAPRDDDKDQGEPAWLGPEAPTPTQREAAQAARREAQERSTRALAASQRLQEFETPLAVAWLAKRPSLARERGLPPLDLKPLALGPEVRRDWRTALERAEHELAAVEWPDLDASRRLDLEWLQSFLRAELVRDALIPERDSPLVDLGEIERVLGGVLGAPELESDLRMRALTRHLTALPEMLLALKASLVHPAPEACALGVTQLDDLAHLVLRMTPRLAASKPSPMLWEPFESAEKRAQLAIAALRTWLLAESREAQPPRLLGREAWEQVLGAHLGHALDANELQVQLLREIAAFEGQGLAAQGAGSDAQAALDALTPASVAQRIRETQNAGWSAARKAGLCEGGPPVVGCSILTAGASLRAPFELAWDERPALRVVARGSAWSESDQARRLAELSVPAQRAQTLTVGFPGEALWQLWTRENTRVTQRVFWNRLQAEGFGLWSADLVTRAALSNNPLAEDRELLLELQRLRRLETVRLLAALELHALGASVESVARHFRDYAHLDPSAALTESRLALLDPLAGAGILGCKELLKAEESLRELFSERQSAWWVGRMVQLAPSTPIAWSLAHREGLAGHLGSPPPAEVAESEPPTAPEAPDAQGR